MLGVKSIQVTLDGDERVHDSRRMLTNGGATFKKIVNNLKEVPHDVEINLRVNVDKENIDSVDTLILQLKKENLTRCTLSIKSVVSANENPCEDKVLETAEFSKRLLPLYNRAHELGFKTVLFNPMIFFRKEFCIVDYEHQYIVSPDGGIFKCGESYEEDDPSKIGYIKSNGEMELNIDAVAKWTKDPFEDEKCCNCSILPLCWGGCQLKRNAKNISPCYTEYKENIEEIIIMYYEMKTGKL